MKKLLFVFVLIAGTVFMSASVEAQPVAKSHASVDARPNDHGNYSRPPRKGRHMKMKKHYRHHKHGHGHHRDGGHGGHNRH